MQMNSPSSAFTTISRAGITLKLLNRVTICTDDNSRSYDALWDTGATATCISHTVVADLGLAPSGKTYMQTPSGRCTVNSYLVDIILPNNVRIKDLAVCEAEIASQGFDVLIGMDIITMGDFAVSTYGGHTVFSFQIPSQQIANFVKLKSTAPKISAEDCG